MKKLQEVDSRVNFRVKCVICHIYLLTSISLQVDMSTLLKLLRSKLDYNDQVCISSVVKFTVHTNLGICTV